MRIYERALFLDIDGVLNHTKTIERDGGCIGIDPTNVARLTTAIETVGETAVVISSAWRKRFQLAELRGRLYAAGLSRKAFIIDKTGTAPRELQHESNRRAWEIVQWYRDSEQVNAHTRICVLDDLRLDASVADWHVRTDEYAGGLLDSHVPVIVKLLSPM